jgi:hypothetical protein
MLIEAGLSAAAVRIGASVVETGNMTRAADRLHVAQTALGMQIRQLEEDLAVALWFAIPEGSERGRKDRPSPR